MSSRNVLVVALDESAEDELREAVRRRGGDDTVTVHVVAPAGDVGVLKWLTGAEDDVRAEAEERAVHTADAVDAETEIEVGDHDPLVAVQDALATFPADEILVAGHGAAHVEKELRRFDVPVARLETGPARERAEDDAPGAGAARTLARGRAPQTPLLLLGVVGLFLLCAITLVSVISFIVFWLV